MDEVRGTVVTTRHFTLADLLDMPPDDDLYEIIGGRLVVFASPNDPHMKAVIELVVALYRAEEAGFGWVGAAPRAVALDFDLRGMQSQDVPQPDVFFIRRERVDILSERPVKGPPDLVIEVLSPTTRRDNLPDGEKFQMYERNAVPHYWTADPVERTVTQFELREGRLVEVARLGERDLATSALFQGITLQVGRLFAPRKS